MMRQSVGGRPYAMPGWKRTPYYCVRCGRKQRGKCDRCKCGSRAFVCCWGEE
jgi:hypothetical protein